ncbi:MAG: hypothetical protein V1917_02235 [Candidatus Gottesmanbacteria bacterium]
MPTKRKNPSTFIDTLLSPKGLTILIIILVILSAGTYFYARRATMTKNLSRAPAPTPTPTPTRLVPDNGMKGTYNVSTSQKTGPRVTKVVFDPLNAQKNKPFTITVHVTNESPVQKVTGTLKMDNSIQNLSFERISRTDTNEMWQTTFSALPDSILYNYLCNVTAFAENGTGEGGASPRSR